MMKVTKYEPQQNGRNLGGKKEMVSAWSLVAVKNHQIHDVITIRWYMGRSSSASVVYCSIWVHGDGYAAGHGQAGGYGYHKPSAAFQEAVDSAGIELDQLVDGRGEGIVREALEAIGRKLGYKNMKIITHG